MHPMLVAMLVIFFCFVILDPWKVIKPEFVKTPAKPGEPALPAPARPDFAQIKIKGRLRSIHNASVKEIRKDGLIFLADEGLVKASFKDLEPEFAKYYLYLATVRKQKAAAASAMMTGEARPGGSGTSPDSPKGPQSGNPRS
jgi:hypothetical protein